MTLAPGTRLGPYEVLGALGAGGMGEVYRARDPRLGRDVAIKVLRASFSADANRLRRFEQEARAAGILNHPNITVLYDIGQHDGAPYVVQELLEGETLRSALAGGKLSPRKAIDMALQIAHGLAAAHEKGIVHRDLKPENLFITGDGRIKILDFGLAKLTQPESAGDLLTSVTKTADLTETGAVMGTVGYMSPEQVKGEKADARSDIFAFGAVLYEMLSGHRAFKGASAVETMHAILKDEPPDLSGSQPGVTPLLDRIVRRCLEKDRANRFQSAKDIAFALSEVSGQSGAQLKAPASGKTKALVVVAIVVILLAASVFFARRSHKGAGEAGGAGEAQGVKRLAVLPFENLGAPEDDYFADGMADEIRRRLTSLPGVEVIDRASSTPYKKTTKRPTQIAQELDVEYLLTATVRSEKGARANRVHVMPELVEVKGSGTAASRWQQPFDAALTDVLWVQSDIATQVARAMGVKNLAAWDAFLKGEEASMDMAVDDRPALRKALGFYEQAVVLDPGFAKAWAQISRANLRLYELRALTPGLNELITHPPEELPNRAGEAAQKAVALAPNRPEGYTALGSYTAIFWSPLGALQKYATGQRLAPGNTDLLVATAELERRLERWETAVEHLRLAERLDPRSVLAHDRLGETLVFLRRYAEAREAIDRGLALAPTHLFLIKLKTMTFLVQGDLAGARAFLKAVPKEVDPTALVVYLANNRDLVWVLDEEQRELLERVTPNAFDDDRASWSLCLAQAYALSGDAASVRNYAEEARKVLEGPVARSHQGSVSLGLALAYLGRKEEAIRMGELSVGNSGESAARHQLARIYTLVGEPGKALDQLERLLKIPYLLSPGWLRIDPNFDPVRKNPRFQKLLTKHEVKP